MIKIESSSGNKKSKSIGTTIITFVLTFSEAAFVASGVSYGAKPSPPTTLNSTVCNKIGGVWALNACTIPAGINGIANQPFTISNGVKLYVQGSLTINSGITVAVANSGTIIVQNAGGVIPSAPPQLPSDLYDWETGIVVYGTLANSGTITIQNVYDATNPIKPQGTEGITVAFSVNASDWNDLSTWVVVPGALTNSGTITIQNGAQTRGIENLGTIDNSASGTITVANSGTVSVGIYNRRYGGSEFYLEGTMKNAGSIPISSSGESGIDSNGKLQYGYGIYNVGFFTNSTTGTFTVNPSPVSDDARGFYNAGSFTNYGTFINNRGSVEDRTDPNLGRWGSFNNSGTMINYGTTSASATGTFYNNLIMLNYGTITSYGVFDDETQGLAMINYGTFYNYGTILGGTNRAICIDEISTYPDASGCR